MYLSRGKREADAKQLADLQKQLARVTLERNQAYSRITLLEAGYKHAEQTALVKAAETLEGLDWTSLDSGERAYIVGYIAKWLRNPT